MFQKSKFSQPELAAYRHRSLRRFIHERRSELRLAIIFLLLIFLPSGLLGYLSWRAVKNEKLLSRQKIAESYRQFIHLAVRDIDHELENVQARLQTAVQKALALPDLERLDSLVKAEPLLSSVALLKGPGQVAFPPGLSLKHEESSGQPEQVDAMAREFDLYTDLANRGEQFEYRGRNLDSAVAVYQSILARVTSPQFRAMALSLLGRAQTKRDDWVSALETYESLLRDYPEEHDLNKTNLRFLAQYQIAVCLENLDRYHEAAEALVRMSQDLVARGDAINQPQYSHFWAWIKTLQVEVLSEPSVPAAKSYADQLQRLAAQDKKPVGDQYFVQLLEDELRELVIERKSYRPLIRYFSGHADDEPFLLGYLPLPDRRGSRITGLLGFRVHLAQLRERILPALLRHLRTSESVVLAILDNNSDYVIGTTKPRNKAVATLSLNSPFEFWQVGVFLDHQEPDSPLSDLNALLWLWLISLLLLSIFLGAYIFIRYARHEARLSELKSTFVSRVSHELRTPLTSIKMLAEHLEMQVRQTAPAREQDLRGRTSQYLSVIRRESDRLGRLIENVLDFAKIERGVKQYSFEYEMPAVVLRKALDAFRPHAEAQGFVIHADIDETLPELLLDADGMTQALLNLLGNAVKYSAGEKNIAVRAFRERESVCIEIQDRGIGISAAQIAKIFDEFYRVDQRLNSKQQSGVGLGLTLVKHIVQAHGGKIEVRSAEGQGSTFAIFLPIPPDDTAAEATQEANQKNDQPVESMV